MANYYKFIDSGAVLRAFSVDSPHAYKTVVTPLAQSRFASIVLASPSGTLHMSSLRTQSCRSSRTQDNWGRVTHFDQSVTERLFPACVFVYVGDVFAGEPLAAVVSAHDAFGQLVYLMGFEMASAKAHSPSASIHLLGEDNSLDAAHLLARLQEHRKCDLRNYLRKILA